MSNDSFDTNKISEGNLFEGLGGDSKAWMERKGSTDSTVQSFVPDPDTGATTARDKQLRREWLQRLADRGPRGSVPQLSRRSTQQFSEPIAEGDEGDERTADAQGQGITDSPAPLSPTGNNDESDKSAGPTSA